MYLNISHYINALASARWPHPIPLKTFPEKVGPLANSVYVYNNFEVLAHFGTFQLLVTPEPDELGS